MRVHVICSSLPGPTPPPRVIVGSIPPPPPPGEVLQLSFGRALGEQRLRLREHCGQGPGAHAHGADAQTADETFWFLKSIPKECKPICCTLGGFKHHLLGWARFQASCPFGAMLFDGNSREPCEIGHEIDGRTNIVSGTDVDRNAIETSGRIER